MSNGNGLFSSSFEYPAIWDGLHLSLLPSPDDLPQHTLVISGFETSEAAIGFVPRLRTALRIASVRLGYSIGFGSEQAVLEAKSHFDGTRPTVLPTSTPPRPFFGSVSVREQMHVATLAALVSQAFASGACVLAEDPRLALSLQLHAEADFAGETNARFMALITAMEVLVEGAGGKKRNAVRNMVKSLASKAYAKKLDALYEVRNSLVHDGVAVTTDRLSELKTIVGMVLQARLAAPPSGAAT